MTPPRRLAVVGAGWAGLAAAVQAVHQGWQVTLLEMAHHPGGRARSVQVPGLAQPLDNGQHILIGAYQHSLRLMRAVGAQPTSLLLRSPLVLRYPDGRGLQLPPGPALPAFARAVLAAEGWRWRDKLALLLAAGRWLAQGFACDERLTVAQLCQGLPAAIVHDLLDPLCVAALNTPMAQASASVFLRVLKDALFTGPGSADLLLPRQGLSALLATPACHWLQARGAQVTLGHRVQQLQPDGAGWRVDSVPFDAVVLAVPASQAAVLTEALAPVWSAQARALRYEPIVTVYLQEPSLQLAHPMLALAAGPAAPAQFILSLRQLGHPAGGFAAVVSGAAAWLDQGLQATAQAVLQQVRQAWPGHFLADDAVVHVAAERRATFACVPGLQRPPTRIAPGLVAAGDYIAGPYPATLEGAVRSGEAAVAALG